MNVLIIGLGSIAKKHIDALHQISNNFKIFALRSSSSSEPYLNVKNLYSLSQIKERCIDFIIISTPTSKHLENIQALIEFDIPLFIEKPLFNTLEVKNVLDQIKRQNLKTYVACNLRFLDSLIYVKNEFLGNANFKVNEVNAYCGSYLPDWRPTSDFKKSYSANRDLGGGVHLDLIHELDYLYWMFDEPLEVHKLLKSKSSLSIDAVDYANYQLVYERFVANVVLNYFRRDAKRYLEVVFDQFTIKVDVIANKVFKNDELIFESDQVILDTYKKQLEYFINNISKPTFNDIEEAYKVLKICL